MPVLILWKISFITLHFELFISLAFLHAAAPQNDGHQRSHVLLVQDLQLRGRRERSARFGLRHGAQRRESRVPSTAALADGCSARVVGDDDCLRLPGRPRWPQAAAARWHHIHGKRALRLPLQ